MSELTKLKIWAFDTNKFEKTVGDKPFIVQINPESFSMTYAVEYSWTNGKGKSGSLPSWEKNPPRSLSFEMLFDNTGATPTAEASIVSRINSLDSIMFNPESEKHQPNFLLIEWGALIFSCCLESMTINYKLFAPDGQPLRASVSASFKEVRRGKFQTRADQLRSPDVTHAFTVKEGDTLPLMAEKVYGDGAYYIAVAQANKLIQFRNLKAGTSVILPPIKKQDG